MRALVVVLFVLVARMAGAATFLSEILTGYVWQLPPVVTYDGVLAYDDGTAYLRDPSGILSPIVTFDPGVTSIDDIVIGSADAGFVYLSGSQGIGVQKREPNGYLTPVEIEPGSPVFPFRDPVFLAVPADGTNLYATTGGGLLTYTRSTSTGELSFLDEIDDIPHLARAEAILVSPDSAHVYVAGDYIFAFDRSGLGGAPSLVATYTDVLGGGYSSIAITADGLELYAGARGGIAHYLRNPATGELTFAGIEPTVVREGLEKLVDRNESLNISADGTRLVGLVQSYMVAYDRDPGTGALSLLTIERNPTKKVTMSPDGVAVYSGAKNGSVYAFTTMDCTPAPASGCHVPAAPAKSALTIKDSDPLRDKMSWRITPGGVTDLAQLGNPLTDADDLVFCLYDASASPQPVLEAVVPARGTCDNDEPCWQLTSSGTNLKYTDAIGMPSGIQKFSVRERAVDRGSIKLKAKGRGLALPALPLTAPVRAQLQSRTGACWEAVYTLPRKNDVTKFNAKSD